MRAKRASEALQLCLASSLDIFERFSFTVKHVKSTRGFFKDSSRSVYICDKCHQRITWFEATTWSPLWSVSITTLTAAIPTKSSKKWWENWKTWLRVVKQCGTSKQKFSFTFSDHYCWGSFRSLLFHPLLILELSWIGFPFFLRHSSECVVH